MTETEKVKLNWSAILGWHSLSPELRTQLWETFTHLAATAPDQWPSEVHPLFPEESKYVLWAPEGLRVVFRREENGQITILDGYLQEWVDRYFSSKP